MTKHPTLLPRTVLSRVDGDAHFDLRCILSSASLSNTCRFGYRNALEGVCACLISIPCIQIITFLALVQMHAM